SRTFVPDLAKPSSVPSLPTGKSDRGLTGASSAVNHRAIAPHPTCAVRVDDPWEGPAMTDLAAPRPSTEQMIGRTDVDDLAQILAVANTDVDSVMHVVANNADAIFTWDYDTD